MSETSSVLTPPSTPPADRQDPPTHKLPADHKQILARYREPNLRRSLWQALSTLILFAMMWAVMLYSLRYSYWVTLLLSVPTAGLMVRLFILQHDCGHGAFFKSRKLNDLFGVALALMVFTPYRSWRRQHALHHATSGDLDRRGVGDVPTLTVNEYQQINPWLQRGYRIYRNPLVLFGIVPVLFFAVAQRFTFDLPRDWKKERASVYWTDLGILMGISGMCWLVGVQQFLLVHVPTTVLASSAGVWLFYVQHTFEETYWQRHEKWDFTTAGFEGSSYYHLPAALQWVTANIGFHHIHHLDSHIPNYRLPECYQENAAFQQVDRLTLWDSLSCVSMKLWDEESGRMVGFKALKSNR